MEKLLVRLARQLDAIDEASLMSLWSKYATATSRFEPTREWEETALVFSLIQAKRWKNQLFNYHWARQARPLDGPDGMPVHLPEFRLETPEQPSEAHRCRVLAFTPPLSDDTPPPGSPESEQ